MMEEWGLMHARYLGTATGFAPPGTPTLGTATPCDLGWLYFLSEVDALLFVPNLPTEASSSALRTARFEAPLLRSVSVESCEDGVTRVGIVSDDVVSGEATMVVVVVDVESTTLMRDFGNVRSLDRQETIPTPRTCEKRFGLLRQPPPFRARGPAELHGPRAYDWGGGEKKDVMQGERTQKLNVAIIF